MSDNITKWLEELGLGQFASVFAEQQIDHEVLPELTDEDLEKLGIPLGPRKKLLKAIGELQRGLATPLPETILHPATPDTSHAERRQLTVMFCDLVGSTTLAERLDPEKLRELLGQYQDTCAEVIHRYDSHIGRYVGDGLLVYFGYPRAHEDDPQRAVRAGLGIVEAIRGLDSNITNRDVNLAVRIGITTGLVVAGDIGSGERVEEKAIVGETPNVAARLQALAQPNTVIIGASTQRLVEGLFNCDDLGEQQLKGISQPVTAYRVREESGAPSRFEASAVSGLTPLVGREEEIGLLLKRWEQTKDGEGQVVLLCSEPGIGKSRIVRSFRERLEGERHNRVLYYGSPYHQNSALYPLIDQLERGLRFERDDSPAQKLDKLDTVLSDLDLPLKDLAPVLASLLSFAADGRYPALQLDPEQLKKKTFEAIVVVIQAMSLQQPVLMVVEDVHWIDPSTLELISLLIEQFQSARFLLLITFRPEFESPWGAHAHVTSFTLNRLSRKESAALVMRVTRGNTLPEEMLDQIVAKTDGVPLFIEELTKTVIESDLLQETQERYELTGALRPLAIPASLQDSLMARLDRLGAINEVAQLAATLGRTFSHELLAAVSPLKESELQEALTQLVHAQLIYHRGLPPDVTYEFKHALVEDTAYRSLLESTRQQYHRRVARVLEEQFPETAQTEPELLAQHYTEAGLAEQAIDYWQSAGERASEHSANVEAVAHLEKGLELIKSLSETPEHAKQELGLLITLGPVLMSTKGEAAPEVEKAYARARELCEQVGDTPQLFPVLRGLWICYLERAALQPARELGEQLLTLAERQQESALLLEAHRALGLSLFWQGELASAQVHLEQGIALYDRQQHRSHAVLYGLDPGVHCLSYAAWALWLLGYPDRAMQRSHEALAWAQELSHPFSLAAALYFTARLHQYRREGPLTRERAEAAVTLSTEQGIPEWLAVASILRGWALADHGGQGEAGIAQMHQGLAAGQATGGELGRSLFLALLGEAYGNEGQTAEGLRVLAEALAVADKNGEHVYEAELRRVEGELRLKQGAAETAGEECFRQALEFARRQQAKSLELRAATSLSRLWHDQGKRSEARTLLAPIYDWFTEGFDTADLKEAKALLEELA